MDTVLSDQPEIELLDGRAYPKVSPKLDHSAVQFAAGTLLRRCAAGRGFVGPELRCRLTSETTFVPDMAYVSYERLDRLAKEERQEPPFAPDIAVEVRSPSNRSAYNAKKFAMYLAHGSALVLDIDPATRTIHAHASDFASRMYVAGQHFAHPAVAWLEFDVEELFMEMDRLARGSSADR